MSQSGPGRREVAYRLFAAEFDDAEFSYSESDEERAPNYVVTPTGARVNRLFVVGVLTEVEDVNPEMVRGRVVDPTGAFVTYAGQYQPEALAFLERADAPSFLALSGKARTFEPDDGDRIFTSVRPESASEVDADTRDRWVVSTAERTLERVGVMASAIESELTGDRLRVALEEAGVDERLADGVALALEYYGTTPAYLAALRETALDAVRVVAGDLEEVGRLDVAPGEGVGDASALATLELSAPDRSVVSEQEETDATGEAEAEVTADAETDVTESAVDAEADTSEDVEATVGIESGEASEDEPVATSTDESTSEDVVTAETADDGEGEVATGASDSSEDETDDFDPGEFELDEEERREIEEEFDTEFSTASEVEQADSDVDAEPESSVEPEPDANAEPEVASEPEPELDVDSDTSDDSEVDAEDDEEPEVDTDSEGTVDADSDAAVDADSGTTAEADSGTTAEADSGTTDGADSGDDGDATDVDLEDAVIEAMESLDEGDGADREAVVASVVDDHGVAESAVEDAIQDALMSGRCYEPDDGTLKSI